MQRPGDGDQRGDGADRRRQGGKPNSARAKQRRAAGAADYRPGDGKRAQSFAKVRHRRAARRRRQVQARIKAQADHEVFDERVRQQVVHGGGFRGRLVGPGGLASRSAVLPAP